MPAFQRRVCLIWIIGPSQRSNAKSKPGFQWVDLVTLPKTGISVSALRWFRCLLPRRQPIFSTTQWSMCVLEELALWAVAFHRPAFEGGWCKQEKRFRMSATDGQKGRKKVLKKKRKWYEKKQAEKESFLWTRWIFNKVCFLFGVFYCTLEFSEVFFLCFPAPETTYLCHL